MLSLVKIYILITLHDNLKWLMIKYIYQLNMFGIDMYTLLYKMDNKDLLCSTGNSAEYMVRT